MAASTERLESDRSAPLVHSGFAYPAWARLALATCLVARFAGVWLVSLHVLLATDPPVTPPLLARQFAVFVALPFVVEWLLRRRFQVRIEASQEGLVLRFARREVQVPAAAIAGLEPWLVPLPACGCTLRLRSGRRLRERLESPDEGLTRRWLVPELSPLRARALAFALARSRLSSWRWHHYLGKFAAFALGPALVAFSLHQNIAYGGFWGEYFLRGPLAYLRTWLEYYLTVVAYLILYAGLWRSVVEAVAYVATLASLPAAVCRQIAERCCQLAYYGGVPVLLALRLLW